MPPKKPGMMIAGNQGGSGAGYSPGYTPTDAFANCLISSIIWFIMSNPLVNIVIKKAGLTPTRDTGKKYA